MSIKPILATLLAVGTCATISARHITFDEAAGIAASVIGDCHVTSADGKLMAYAASESRSYYIFNSEDNRGFAIISTDDKIGPLLAYSNTGQFNAQSVPPQLRHLLNAYTVAFSEDIPQYGKTDTLDEEIVLNTAEWGQGEPYNSQCPLMPKGRALTGCVATAMAIVMQYHSWPQSYDWDAINADKSSPELARLMFDAAISAETEFDTMSSLAVVDYTFMNLIGDFDFSPIGQIIYPYNRHAPLNENSYPYWEDVLQDNIRHSMPVIYSAINSEATEAHAFVVDGIGKGGTYHINWGWDGAYNGFYRLDALAVADQIFDWQDCMNVFLSPERDPERHSGWSMQYDQTRSASGLHVNVPEIRQGTDFLCQITQLVSPIGKYNDRLAIALTDADGEVKELLSTWDNAGEGLSGLVTTRRCKPAVAVDPTDRIQLLVDENKAGVWKEVVGSWISPSGCSVSDINASTSSFAVQPADDRVGCRIILWDINDNIYVESPGADISLIKDMKLSFEAYTRANCAADGCVLTIITDKDTGMSQSYAMYQSNENAGPMFSYENAMIYPTADSYTVDIRYVNAPQTRVIHVEKPGTLADSFNGDDALTVGTLTLSGTIDARDLWFIRDNMCALRYLDLSTATIVASIATDPKYKSFTAENLANDMPYYALFGMENIKWVKLPDTLLGVGEHMFTRWLFAETIDLPASLQEVRQMAFADTPSLKNVICRATTPPNAENIFFLSPCLETGTLYVPEGCKDAYAAHSEWGQFRNIVEGCDKAGVQTAVKDSKDGIIFPANVYTPAGVLIHPAATPDQLQSLPRGLYIIDHHKVILK